MNSGCLKLFIRIFHKSSIYAKTSPQAKFMVKIMGGNNKKKAHKFFVENQASNTSHDFLTQTSGKNTKLVSRRVSVLNSVFLERITEIMSSSNIGEDVHPYNFLITKVKFANDGTAIHVYWYADHDISTVEKKLPQIGGRLRHELSQLQNGKVPHINFIKDPSNCKATDVEELLKVADFGPDYLIPSPASLAHKEQVINQLKGNESGKHEELVKRSDLLGIDRDAIINQVKRSMRHIYESTPAKPSSYVCDIQRRIDFKKYIQDQEILRDKIERRRANQNERNVDLSGLTRQKDDEYIDDDMFLEKDIFDEEN